MATTYTAIATVTVGGGGASSIAFTSIPQIYTDLLVKLSPKSTRTDAPYEGIELSINSNTTDASYWRQVLMNNENTTVAAQSADRYVGWTTTNGGTASVFGLFELYFPNYRLAETKAYMSDFTSENNAAAVTALGFFVNYFNSTAAITSMSFNFVGGNNFAQYSTATLYGIKNS